MPKLVNMTVMKKNGVTPTGRRPQGGYTIIELMVVVAIAAILAMVALPEMNYAIQDSRVRTASADTLTSLMLARSEAIKRNNDVDLDRTGADWLGGWSVNFGATTLTTQDPLNGVSMECYTDPAATTACGATLSFERTGRASSYIEFRVYGDNNAVPMRCIRVSLSGRPGITLDTNEDPTDGCN